MFTLIFVLLSSCNFYFVLSARSRTSFFQATCSFSFRWKTVEVKISESIFFLIFQIVESERILSVIKQNKYIKKNGKIAGCHWAWIALVPDNWATRTCAALVNFAHDFLRIDKIFALVRNIRQSRVIGSVLSGVLIAPFFVSEMGYWMVIWCPFEFSRKCWVLALRSLNLEDRFCLSSTALKKKTGILNPPVSQKGAIIEWVPLYNSVSSSFHPFHGVSSVVFPVFLLSKN